MKFVVGFALGCLLGLALVIWGWVLYFKHFLNGM